MLTAERLRELLHYNPETGLFTRRTRSSRNTVVGEVAGALDKDGYVKLSIDGRSYRAHRLAFLWMTGAPLSSCIQVDHINGARDDNRWQNLRSATANENQQNRLRADRFDGRTSSRLGVSKKAKGARRFEANIRTNGKLKYLGRFATEDEAADAYIAAKAKLHPGATLSHLQKETHESNRGNAN